MSNPIDQIDGKEIKEYYSSKDETLTDLRTQLEQYLDEHNEAKCFIDFSPPSVQNPININSTVGFSINSKECDNTKRFLNSQLIHLAENILLFIKLYQAKTLLVYWSHHEYKDQINNGLYDSVDIRIQILIPNRIDQNYDFDTELSNHLFKDNKTI